MAAVALLGYQTGIHEVLQMKGQGRRRNLELLGDGAGRHAGLASDDEETKHPKAKGLRQSGQRPHNLCFFHDMMIIELWKRCRIRVRVRMPDPQTRNGFLTQQISMITEEASGTRLSCRRRQDAFFTLGLAVGCVTHCAMGPRRARAHFLPPEQRLG
jgi:hypothetical protein